MTRLTASQVELTERLTELILKVVLFFFILLGVTVFSGFFIYCVLNDKGGQAKTISGYGDAIFVTAFGKIVWNYFVRTNPQTKPGGLALEASAGHEDSDADPD